MKINSNKIKNLVQQILNILVKKFPLFFLIFITFYFMLGGVLIYRHNILTQITETYTTEKKQNILKEDTHQKILEHWEVKKIKFDEINQKKYSDPFIEKTEEKIDEQPTEEEKTPAEIKEKAPAETKEETKKNDSEPTIESFFGKINNLFEYYTSGGKKFLSIYERAKIWEQEGMGTTEEYHGFRFQNIKLLEQLTK